MIGNETQNIATGAYTPTFDKEPKKTVLQDDLTGQFMSWCIILPCTEAER